jgi:hypothetical protein
MTHRPLLRACAAVLAAAAVAGCGGTPTDPARPGTYQVAFIGVPAGAQSFAPRAVAGERVVGVAADANRAWAVQWTAGGFSLIGPAVPTGCHSEPTAARGAATVGQVTCTATGAPAGQPVDVYGWVAGGAVPRLFAEPYTFTGVTSDGAGVVGTVNPSSQFPQAQSRAFLRTAGGVTELLPPDAIASEAAGIGDAGDVVVTAYYDCPDEDGEADDDCYPTRAMVWNAGAWTEIPLPGDAERAVAVAVSSEGHVAGYAFGEADGVFLYRISRRDLDGLPVIPGTRVVLTGVNSLPQVVGTGIREQTTGQATSYGIVWGDERTYDLTERIGGTIPWQITSALATDDEGRIAATGVDRQTGQEGAILLTPSNL